MDSEALKLFLHLSGSLHFGKTSEALHLSPSTLSRSIKRLEDEIGQKLFERDNRTVNLTVVGLQFQQYAKEALEHWQKFENAITCQSKHLQGEIRLYSSVTASYSILYKILSLFRQRYPRIEIKLRTGDVARAIPNVLEEQEDIAIAAKPDQIPNKLCFLEVAESPLLFIAPAIPCAVRELLQENPIAWHQIPMVLSEGGLARKRVDQWFKAKGIKPNIYTQVSGNEAIVSMVSLGFGVGIVPHLVLESSPVNSKIEVLKVSPSLDPFAVGICTLARKIENPLVRAFWAITREAFELKS